MEYINTNYSAIKSEIVKTFRDLYKSENHETTHYVPVGSKGNNRWAVVLAWMDYEGDDNWQVYGKVAYQPKNSVMQEYDIDWEMPEYDGDVVDSEVSITPDSVSNEAAFLADQWKWVVENLLSDDVTESYTTESIVMDYLMEGKTLSEAMSLAEDTITPDMISKIEQTPSYKKLKRDIEYYFKACDDIDAYRDGDFKKSPVECLEDEADFCQETADFLGSIQLKGFKPEVKSELMQATAADMEYLDRSATRLKNILKKQDDSVYLNDDGSVNVNTNQKPGDYARRALRKIRDFFARLGVDWDYNPDFNYKAAEPKNPFKLFVTADESKANVKEFLDVCVSEGLSFSDIKSIKGDLTLDEQQKDLFDKYLYYLFD